MSDFNIRVIIDDKKEGSGTSVKKRKSKTSVEKPMFQITKGKSAVAIGGSLLGTAGVINGFVGEYTENRLRQRRIGVGLKFGAYALAFASGNPIAILGATADIVQTRLRYNINLQKQEIESSYIREISGKSSFSGSRGR